MISLFGFFSLAATCMQVGMSFYNVWAALGTMRFVTEGLPGVSPFACWLAAFLATFSTEWGWAHPSLGALILCPAYCLINSKLIVCNFTKMETPMFAFETFLFVLFPLNKICKSP